MRSHEPTGAWLRSSPGILYSIFPKELVSKLKVQLEELKKIALEKPKYSIVEVTNGQFCKLPVQS